ncbi:dihydrofolate reductase family protein [Mesorhizobium marinum]
MRKLIAGMKVSLDGKYEGPESVADWVEAWSDDYGLMAEVDACVLGAGMYGGYERYWTSVQTAPDTPAWISGAPPTPAERQWADFIRRTPHYVLSATLDHADWPDTAFIRGVADLAALKQQAGKSIYLVGGGRTTAGLIDAGVVDELRLIVYPVIAGDGKALFATGGRRQGLDLRRAEPLGDGRVRLAYGIG